MRRLLMVLSLLAFAAVAQAETPFANIAGNTAMYTKADVDAAFQPLDADLTSIAALTTTAFGRGILDDADATAGRTTLGLGTVATMAGPSGAIIGTTDSQTLTNKTIVAGSNTISGITQGMLSSPTTISSNAGLFQGRLDYSNATTLKVSASGGSSCEVNGEILTVNGSTHTLVTTDHLISSTGATTGAGMGASTLYYIYLSNASATTFPSDLRGSVTAPTLFSGVYYLGNGTDSADWRFVGWARTNASTQVADDTTNRLIVSYYNRVRASMLIQPGYSDNNAGNSYTTTSTAWVAANGGTGSSGSYICNGEDAVVFQAHCTADGSAGNGAYFGLGQSTTNIYSACSGLAAVRITVTISYTSANSGYYAIGLFIASSSTGTCTFYADNGRTPTGAAADPRFTYMEGTVWK